MFPPSLLEIHNLHKLKNRGPWYGPNQKTKGRNGKMSLCTEEATRPSGYKHGYCKRFNYRNFNNMELKQYLNEIHWDVYTQNFLIFCFSKLNSLLSHSSCLSMRQGGKQAPSLLWMISPSHVAAALHLQLIILEMMTIMIMVIWNYTVQLVYCHSSFRKLRLDSLANFV